jgi:hypothetical protein
MSAKRNKWLLNFREQKVERLKKLNNLPAITEAELYMSEPKKCRKCDVASYEYALSRIARYDWICNTCKLSENRRRMK